MKPLSTHIHALSQKLRAPMRRLSIVLCAAVLWQAPAYAAGSVSVSNHPLFLLSEAVTKGTPSAHQILHAGDVGHHGSISPSDKKRIQDSTFVVWFGHSLENSLSGTLETAPNAIALLDFDAFKRHPLRDIQTQPISNTEDPHIWLDPDNAKAITRALAAIHTHANPQYKDIYQANVKSFAKRMDAAVQQVQTRAPQRRAYWAYHDAYQYIENAANIRLAGSLSPDHHLAPKASQLRWLTSNRPRPQMCLVNQGDTAKGLQAKLKPLQTSVQLEDMSDSDDFVTGWLTMAQQINSCIDGV
ncbi:metal ABC transporter solute-binding protein, Zn/Mn family [Psychrobacter aestuarii]|uniref:High-affinity zinc uptake system protein ZnuA n=1 Tax=Psychrobacter aestuarii TaxID=556327 RepID=A0ABP3FS22_9GAMM|nr:zinc ABC transporter substrate-binding protein [Psychrobacter aestuarii]